MLSLDSDICALDVWLDRAVGKRHSLCPGRSKPTPFAELWTALDLDTEHLATVMRATERVVAAIVEHYPDNVFWDLDHLVQALSERETPGAVEWTADRIVRLMQGFGMKSEIRFRYVHDFTYGFDWAKWVARDPRPRNATRPFDDAFLGYLELRQSELLELIRVDDATYGRLRDERPRNPFGFSREPEDERRLHALLAERGQVPLLAWERQGSARWGAHFAATRAQTARELGLAES